MKFPQLLCNILGIDLTIPLALSRKIQWIIFQVTALTFDEELQEVEQNFWHSRKSSDLFIRASATPGPRRTRPSSLDSLWRPSTRVRRWSGQPRCRVATWNVGCLTSAFTETATESRIIKAWLDWLYHDTTRNLRTKKRQVLIRRIFFFNLPSTALSVHIEAYRDYWITVLGCPA